jgi:hypothetical protein
MEPTMPKPTVTFEVLREIAETASGLRNEDLYFIIRGEPGESATYTWQTTPPADSDDTVVIHCNGVDDPPTRVDYARIGTAGEAQVNLLRITVPPVPPHPGGTYAADAVFWSVSAVEKFLVPYYASVYGDEGPRMAQQVLQILDTAAAEEGDAFAVAHLPSSEYVPEYAPHLVVLNRSGRHRRVAVDGPQGAEPRIRTRGSRKRYARSSGR